MSLVTDLKDTLKELQNDRLPWENHWLEIARFALPSTERFDDMLGGSPSTAIDSVALGPNGANDARAIYDQTSLWAIDRLAAGIIALKTPESEKWHGLQSDDLFGQEFTPDEEEWGEQLRDYLFTVRGNPASGFWLAHKIAIRAMCAYGHGIKFVDAHVGGGSKHPMSYRSVPVSEGYLRANYEGVVDTNFRLFRRSARQLAGRFGKEQLSGKTQDKLADPKTADKPVTLCHAVLPRKELGMYGSNRFGSRGMEWGSFYFEPEADHMIGESGFVEFPYIVHHWQRTTNSPYSESPVSLALAEIKSLNILSKAALKAAQQAVNPPMGTFADSMNRLNLNPGKMNPGAVSEDGKMLAQPLITAQRPDFAQSVIEAKRNSIREMLYLNLWQVLIESPQMTATEALIRSQEKGELLGPVGISLNEGLSKQVDREISILERKGAFRANSPLAPPETISEKGIGVMHTSPLDRLRRMGELVGMQRLLEFLGPLIEIKPDILTRLDFDEMIDIARDVLGVPIKAIKAVEDVQGERDQQGQLAAMQQMMQVAQQGGEAAQAAGAGVQAIEEGGRAQMEPLPGQGAGGAPQGQQGGLQIPPELMAMMQGQAA